MRDTVAMVDYKVFVYNAARDNNLAALKVSAQQLSKRKNRELFLHFCHRTNEKSNIVHVLVLGFTVFSTFVGCQQTMCP